MVLSHENLKLDGFLETNVNEDFKMSKTQRLGFQCNAAQRQCSIEAKNMSFGFRAGLKSTSYELCDLGYFTQLESQFLHL